MAGLATNRTIGTQEKEVFGRLLFVPGIVFFLDTFLFLLVSSFIYDPIRFFRTCIGVRCGLWRSPTTSATHVLNTYFLQPLESTLPPSSPYAETGNRPT